MRLKILLAVAFTFCIFFLATGSLGIEKTTLNSPSAFLPERNYTFAPVVDGTEIMHDFIMQNKGTAPLKIAKVKTG